MRDSSVLALIFAVYAALAVIFYVVTTVKLGRPFLIPEGVYASSNNSNDDDDLPACKNGVVQYCKVKGGITCIVEERDGPYMDIWYGLTGGGWPECCDAETTKIVIRTKMDRPSPE